jgi:hypothetical protein
MSGAVRAAPPSVAEMLMALKALREALLERDTNVLRSRKALN